MGKKWVACDVEDAFFGDDRKLRKQEKKILRAKDRSKFKKTDREKQDAKKMAAPAEGNLLRGRVLSILPQGMQVQSPEGLFSCSLKGVLKKEKTLQKNLVAVGDFVLFEKNNEAEGTIAYVEPRYSTLSRADNLSRRKEQLLAANIDLVLITTSVIMPPLKPSLIDRYIIAARKGGMDPVIVVNKIDLLESDPESEENEFFETFKQGYLYANIPVIAVSTVTGEGLDELKAIMKGKSSVFSGQSGVGKSSLINAIAGLELKIGEPVERTKKGAHTTTTAQLIPLEFGGFCIDTPGIRSFGIWDLKLEEVEQYFGEIHEIGRACKFPDCNHFHEAGCAVIKAVEEGKISPLRYESYLALRESVQETHMRR